jgi:hypothetical protein
MTLINKAGYPGRGKEFRRIGIGSTWRIPKLRGRPVW